MRVVMQVMYLWQKQRSEYGAFLQEYSYKGTSQHSKLYLEYFAALNIKML